MVGRVVKEESRKKLKSISENRKKRLDKILEILKKVPKRWKELKKILDISESTLSRDLNLLKDIGLVHKVIHEGSVAYKSDAPTLKIFDLDRWKEDNKNKIKQLKYLKETGFFSKEGYTMKDTFKFFKKFPIPHTGKKKSMINLEIFLRNMADPLGPFSAPIEVNLKMPREIYKKRLENLKESKERLKKLEKKLKRKNREYITLEDYDEVIEEEVKNK